MQPVNGQTFTFKGSWWSPERENVELPTAQNIVNQAEIATLLTETKQQARDPKIVSDIIDKAFENATLKNVKACELKDEFVQGLSLKDVATLLNCDFKDPSLRQKLYDTAFAIKNRIYGNRIVLFAPIYTANYCSNSCTYCGFRGANAELDRVALTDDQLRQEVQTMLGDGHKRTLMLCGEHPRYSFDQFLNHVNVVADHKGPKNSEMRRINVEIPPLSVSDLKRLKNEGRKVGTYITFQETYHEPSYKKFHQSGPKANYQNRLSVMHRSLKAGLDDIGIGVLYGLYDYKFDTLAMVAHAQHLNDTVGVGPHTISVPRIKPANNAPTSQNVPNPVNDEEFKKIVAVLRLAVPYTGMILSTRESIEMRNDLLKMGISQLSAGSCTDPGGYAKKAKEGSHQHTEQFELADERSLDQIILGLIEDGFVPSQCTSCYGLGRTGEVFMNWAKTGDIQNYCLPNGLITLQEYLQDFAGKEVKQKGQKVVSEYVEKIENEVRKDQTKKVINEIKTTSKRGQLF
ncbi:FeFe-hydrogenase_assembly protein HydG [Hexamita inflata]|uniref:FeFe-hydrogenase assembly protein HydG n=1 Tax=Hexamita inflata TaxID=28002 RepID=A0AA86U7K6_9EUKA|nr:FeFe-hydrogenase assembly protein HydG [Hexamita inflata]